VSAGVLDRPTTARLSSIDRIRGLAVLCMIFDHAVIVFVGAGSPLRWTLGRLAMPLFFLLGGYLVRRLSWRHGWVFVLGCFLPVVVPWVDSPNVLVWYAVGAVILWSADTVWARWLTLAVGLALSANFPDQTIGSSYAPGMLVGLMIVGALLRHYHGSGVLAWGRYLPRWFAPVGRYPLTIYVGHLLVLRAVQLLGLT